MRQNKTRQTLIQRVKEQYDENSWQEFVGSYRAYLYVVIKNMKFNHQDCEDLSQEILLKVWKAIPNFDYRPERCMFRSWLLTIAKNTINNFISSSQARKIRDGEKAISTSLLSPPEISEIAERQWKIYISKKAMDNVREDFSEKVFDVFLRFNRGEKAAFISAQTDIAENTVHVYSSRVQKALKKEIIRLESQLN